MARRSVTPAPLLPNVAGASTHRRGRGGGLLARGLVGGLLLAATPARANLCSRGIPCELHPQFPIFEYGPVLDVADDQP